MLIFHFQACLQNCVSDLKSLRALANLAVLSTLYEPSCLKITPRYFARGAAFCVFLYGPTLPVL